MSYQVQVQYVFVLVTHMRDWYWWQLYFRTDKVWPRLRVWAWLCLYLRREERPM